jgi:chemotaxis response regulator CheB
MRTVSIAIMDTGSKFSQKLEESLYAIITQLQARFFLTTKITFIKCDSSITKRLNSKEFDFVFGVDMVCPGFKDKDKAYLPRIINFLYKMESPDPSMQSYMPVNLKIHNGEIEPEVVVSIIIGYMQKDHDGKLARVVPNNNIQKKYKIIGIAASTGGPEAISYLIEKLSPSITQPILITQHMPGDFIQAFASQLQRKTKRQVFVARDGLSIHENAIYIAPHDAHLIIYERPQGLICGASKEQSVHFLRPAADPMFSSLARTCGDKVIGIVLTGMGIDGTNGAKKLHEAGASVIVQDESTSVVASMPMSVANAGYANHITPLSMMPQLLWNLIVAHNNKKDEGVS